MKNSNKYGWIPGIREGQRLPLIFLPGWCFSVSIWDNVIASLNDFNCYPLELPTKDLHQIEDAVIKQVLAFIKNKAIIIAWSMSGLFAIKFCYEYPHLCKKLILVNSTPKFVSTDGWLGISKNLANRFLRQSKENEEYLLNRFINLVQYPHYSAPITSILMANRLPLNHQRTILFNYLEFLCSTDYRSLLTCLDLPISYYFGEKDAIIPIQSANKLATLNKNITIRIISEASHIPFISHENTFMNYLMDDLYEPH